MSFKTVSSPGLLGDLVGDELFQLLGGPAYTLLMAVVIASVVAAIMMGGRST